MKGDTENTERLRDALRRAGFSEDAVNTVHVYEIPEGNRFEVSVGANPADVACRLAEWLAEHCYMTPTEEN